VVVVAAAVRVFRSEEQAGHAQDRFKRDDVPGVFGQDVDGEEVDLGGLVGDGAGWKAAVGVGAPGSFDELGGAFDLDAEKAAAVVDDVVVALAFAMRFGDNKAVAGGAVGEGKFGKLSPALGVEFLQEGGAGIAAGAGGRFRRTRFASARSIPGFPHWPERKWRKRMACAKSLPYISRIANWRGEL